MRGCPPGASLFSRPGRAVNGATKAWSKPALAKSRLGRLGGLTRPGDETAKAVALEKGAHLRGGRCEGLPGHRHIEAVRLLGDGKADAGSPISLHDGQELSAGNGVDPTARSPVADRRIRLEHCRSAA